MLFLFSTRQAKDSTVSADLQQSSEGNPLARGLIPPYIVLRDFLEEETVAGLLDHALSHQSDFTPSQTLRSGDVDPSYRVSMGLRDLGKFRQLLQTKIFDLLPSFVTELRTMPVEEPKFEAELVAHGDGAFYKRHIDTEIGQGIKQYRVLNGVYYYRVLSGVYYFNAEPKAFTGGALRLHAIGSKECKSFVDIEPIHNSLLVFLAWVAPHEVLPVSCPSKKFIDSRFAINCWVHGRKAGTSA
jgi:SM-20-related protein